MVKVESRCQSSGASVKASGAFMSAMSSSAAADIWLNGKGRK